MNGEPRTPYSPGEWVFIEGQSEKRSMSTIRMKSKPDFLIGYVLCDPTNPHARTEDIANARLIAAAPELVEALQGMVELLRIAEVHPRNPIVARAQLAIDQALGKGVG